MSERRVEYMPLGALKGNPANAKRHDLDGVRASMTRFGLIDTIVLDERTGLIVSGHGRRDSLLAAWEANEAAPEHVEDRDGEWWVPVVRGWASANDTEALGATIAVNRWTERGGWNTGELLDQLAEIEAGEGLAGLGFAAADIDDLMAAVQETTADGDGDGWGDDDGARQVRSFMLDFPIDDYAWVTATAQRARDAIGVGSNAELFAALLEAEAQP